MKHWAFTKHDKFNDEELLTGPKLFRDKYLTDDFTDRVMNQVIKTEIYPASKKKLSNTHGKGRSSRMSRTLLLGGTILVGGGIITSSIMMNPTTVSQPAISSTSKRLHIIPEEWKALDLLDAKKLGVIQQPNIEVSDQGYSLTLQEVVADPTRMVLNLRITDKSGKPVDEAMSMFDASQLQIQNKDGEVIGKGPSVKGWYSETEEGKSTQEYLLLTYTFPDGEPSDTVFIQGSVHKLVTDYKKGKSISGDWSFNYEADMTKAKKLSVTTELDESYTTPDGLNIEMERLVHTPAGVKIEFNTSLTDEASARTPEELRKELRVMYHFVNEKNEDLTRVNSPKGDGYLDKSFDYTVKKTDLLGKLHWTYYFTSLPYDSQPVTFVLGGYHIPIKSSDSITFNPQKLSLKPAIFKAQGDTLNINTMEITENADEPGLSGWMAISGTFTNNFTKDVWIAHDAQDNEYEVIWKGAYTVGEKIHFGETPEHSNQIHMIIKDLKKIPEKLTLTRIQTDKRYTNVKWSFKLPQIKRNEALSNQ